MHLTCALTTTLFLSPLVPLVAAAGGFYSANSPVIELDSKSYDRLIVKSNYTSIVEFYAPWCGHCQNLKPAYEKAATALAGYAKVAAVNCDEETNKGFCGQMGVKGFPTLKIVKPAKKAGTRPLAEDYQGARTAKAINDALLDKMPNHVKKLTDKTLDDWLKEGNDTAKGLLFTDKTPVSPLMKALAIDFLGSISFAQVKSSEKAAVAAFGVTSFPTMLLLPGGTKDGIIYDGDLKKPALLTFFTQVAAPNPDPPPVDATKAKKPKSSTASKAKKDKDKDTANSDLPKGHPPADADAECPFSKDSASADAKEGAPATPPVENAAPPPADEPAAIPLLPTGPQLQEACLNTKSSTCILALLPPEANDALPTPAVQALDALAQIAHKHIRRGFPFYGVPATNDGGMALGVALGLWDAGVDGDGVHVIAVNAKRGWWSAYKPEAAGGHGAAGLDRVKVEAWVDDVRFGDFVKEKLPADVEVIEGIKKTKGKVPFETVVEVPVEGGEESPIKVEILDDDESPIKIEMLEEIEEEIRDEL